MSHAAEFRRQADGVFPYREFWAEDDARAPLADYAGEIALRGGRLFTKAAVPAGATLFCNAALATATLSELPQGARNAMSTAAFFRGAPLSESSQRLVRAASHALSVPGSGPLLARFLALDTLHQTAAQRGAAGDADLVSLRADRVLAPLLPDAGAPAFDLGRITRLVLGHEFRTRVFGAAPQRARAALVPLQSLMGESESPNCVLFMCGPFALCRAAAALPAHTALTCRRASNERFLSVDRPLLQWGMERPRHAKLRQLRAMVAAGSYDAALGQVALLRDEELRRSEPSAVAHAAVRMAFLAAEESKLEDARNWLQCALRVTECPVEQFLVRAQLATMTGEISKLEPLATALFGDARAAAAIVQQGRPRARSRSRSFNNLDRVKSGNLD